MKRKLFRHFGVIVLTVLLGATSLESSRAQATPAKAAKVHPLHYLAANKPDVLALLSPPPLPGSPEQAADLEETITVHQRLTAEGKEKAKSEQAFSPFSFASSIGPIFQPEKLPKTAVFLKHLQEDVDNVTDTGKNFWQRPRPYMVDPALAKGDGDLEKTFSYPSGHSTRGTVFAAVLAEIFPDKKDQIIAQGREIGWHRVELARHYPTDIYAGRVLAAAIVRELKVSQKFQKDLTEVKSEVAAAIAAEKNAALAPVAAH